MMINPARAFLAAAIAASGLMLPHPARADKYPMLEQLNHETQSLYRDVQAGLVRVQLPTPRWIREAAAKDDLLNKWDKVIDPKVRARIEEQQKEIAERGLMKKKIAPVIVAPTTQPVGSNAKPDAGGTSWKVVKDGNGEIVLEPRGAADSALVLHAGADGGPAKNNLGGALQLKAIANGSFAPNNIGLLISDQGHVLVPLFIEREVIGDAGVPVMVADEKTFATFVGSDEKTNVTILKMEKVIGKAVRIGFGRPIEGSLVMMLNPASGSGRVQLWTGGERDFGVVVSMDGSVAGFARYGQFLGTAAAKPVIDQLIAVGKVQRAVLGVKLTEVRGDDRLRQRIGQLGDRPALVVDEVTIASPAERAGLKAGDVILELEEQPVGDLTTWSALLARGGECRLLILRNGKPEQIRVNLQAPAPE
jgi:hypothetical protein